MSVNPKPSKTKKRARPRATAVAKSVPSTTPATASTGTATPSTRERLIKAAIDVVRSEGAGALTSVRITQVAGIAQPRFYKYFKNVDECLREAAVEVVNGMRDVFAAMRRSLDDRNDPALMQKHFEALFDAVSAERSFMLLLYQSHADASPLNVALRAAERSVRDELIKDLWKDAQRAGVHKRHLPQVQRLAELILSTVDGCCEVAMDLPEVERPALARELAHYTIAGTKDAFARMLGRSK